MARGTSGHSPASIQEHLRGVDYPASKEELIRAAQHQNAPEEVVQELRNLPGNRFNSPTDVTEAYGKQH